ncbi:hypothetical protein M501DRAFT_1035128 [Patellaria atrata CBS 101060]|uniref:Uncharacterized protein n=1 Tax=Patellaria atrata CBS 101060 TaxID=1346257 RepID=A0A9P4S418_9PEZI|nr:hypothetical protein M501DRAFT_1035128 [Patellaria atrata CBS 101060]
MHLNLHHALALVILNGATAFGHATNYLTATYIAASVFPSGYSGGLVGHGTPNTSYHLPSPQGTYMNTTKHASATIASNTTQHAMASIVAGVTEDAVIPFTATPAGASHKTAAAQGQQTISSVAACGEVVTITIKPTITITFSGDANATSEDLSTLSRTVTVVFNPTGTGFTILPSAIPGAATSIFIPGLPQGSNFNTIASDSNNAMNAPHGIPPHINNATITNGTISNHTAVSGPLVEFLTSTTVVYGNNTPVTITAFHVAHPPASAVVNLSAIDLHPASGAGANGGAYIALVLAAVGWAFFNPVNEMKCCVMIQKRLISPSKMYQLYQA